jgi:hypothetical protein
MEITRGVWIGIVVVLVALAFLLVWYGKNQGPPRK